jgi:hypothetical protein
VRDWDEPHAGSHERLDVVVTETSPTGWMLSTSADAPGGASSSLSGMSSRASIVSFAGSLTQMLPVKMPSLWMTSVSGVKHPVSLERSGTGRRWMCPSSLRDQGLLNSRRCAEAGPLVSLGAE